MQLTLGVCASPLRMWRFVICGFTLALVAVSTLQGCGGDESEDTTTTTTTMTTTSPQPQDLPIPLARQDLVDFDVVKESDGEQHTINYEGVGAQDVKQLSGTALLTMLKASPPKVPRYSKAHSPKRRDRGGMLVEPLGEWGLLFER